MERSRAGEGRQVADRQTWSAWRVLATRNFLPYFVGNLLSNCGTWFQNIAQALLVFRLTGSPLLVGVVNFAQFAGVLILAPWAGNAADRFDRRKLLVRTQLLSAAATGGLALLAALGPVPVPVVIVIALVVGLANAFAVPAMQAMVPALVNGEQLPAAVALNSVTFNLARALGPVGGAFVVSRYGIPTAFAVNSLSYLALVGALSFVEPRRQEFARRAAKMRDGIRLVTSDKRLLAFLTITALVGLSSDPVATLTPSFATEVFDHPDTLAGYLVGAFGAGAVFAALVVAGRGRPTRRKIALALIALGGGMSVFATSGSLGVAVAGLFVGGFGYLTTVTATTTLLQLEVDDATRGRVMAMWSVAFLGVRPFASLADGATASAIGPQAAAQLMALPALAGAAAVVVLRRRGGTRRDA
jgi:MFS family permease